MFITAEPQFFIRPCCPENGTEALINITGSFSDDGVYIYNGSNLSIPGTDVTLVPGACYTISGSGLVGNVTSIALADLTEFYANSRCDDPTVDAACPDCTPDPGNYYIKAIPCCGGDAIFFKGEGYTGGTGVTNPGGQLGGSQQATPSIPQFSINNFSGVYLFLGFVQQSQQSLLGLEVGQCYTFSSNSVSDPSSEITQAEYDLLGYPPYISQLDFVSKTDCDTVDAVTGERICPDCEEICYRLTSCTGIIINTVQDFSLYVGTYIELSGYTGSWLVQINEGICQDPSRALKISGTGASPCPCLCYEVIGESGGISYIDCDGVSQYTYGPAKFCAQAPPLIKGVEGEDYTLITGTDCVDGECVEQCFLLTNCDPTAYPNQDATLNSTLQSLSQYANSGETVVLSGYEGCWTVTEKTCSCLTITIDGTAIEALATSTYNGQSVFTFEYTGLTYSIWFDGGWFITLNPGDFSNDIASTESTDNCPVFGSFDDPVTPDPTGWRSNPSGTIITTVLCDDQCDCPVDVTVIQDYVDCDACLGIRAYKLTNCEKINEIVYTTQDLSAYVGQVVKDDCACWTVEEIDYQPPSETTINNPILYSECTSCLTTYYVLTDCDGIVDPIITSTNLSAYIEQVIKIQGCAECYTVSEYTDPSEPSNWEEITLVEAFTDCPTCKELDPRCSTVFNNSTEDRTFTYIDANGDSQETEIVKSGHFSLRHCVQYWDEPDTFIYNYYGDCTVFEDELGVKTGLCVQYFPNNRKVKPGYNTPICSAEKYDKITCKAADIMYKKVLELRYGISNCCPEEDEKWLIKKELIELQALTDPNYKCDPLTDCCGDPTSQCSCNS